MMRVDYAIDAAFSCCARAMFRRLMMLMLLQIHYYAMPLQQERH